MEVVPERGALPARSGAEILAMVPGASDRARLEVEDFDRLPGPHWTPQRMLELSRLLDLRLATGHYHGAVVTHGTDTLEETAYLLDVTLRTTRPVVITGAMRTFDDPVSDGPANVLRSIECAGSGSAGGKGVLVVLDGTIHAAREVVKAHTESLGAFTSPGKMPLGIAGVQGIRFDRSPQPRERLETDRVEPRVDLLAVAAGTDGRQLRDSVAAGARGIVLQALGLGNVPPVMLAEVRAAVRAGVPVVVASRCPAGKTAPVYGYEGGGFTLREAGALFAGDLSAPKARIKLMLLLGAELGPAALRESFEGTG